MKCQQCGTELDRLSKWRGSSEFCSEECKKAHQEEFNRLAMTRLMQPRPLRTNTRAAAAAVRTVESTTGRLTMITHPPGASSPILTEPPEAGFIMEASATLAELQVRHQPPVTPRASSPVIPTREVPMADALAALNAMLKGMRPVARPARALSPLARRATAIPARGEIAFSMPAADLAWPASLGIEFPVIGLDNVSIAPASTEVTVAAEPIPGAPAVTVTPAVAHRAIPQRRGEMPLPALDGLALGAERLLPAPILTAPRLRIHLPKPVLNPFRPKYAFAPREEAAPEVAAQEVAAPETKTAKSVQPTRDERRSRDDERRSKDKDRNRRGRDSGIQPAVVPAKQEAKQEAKPKPEAKPEIAAETKVAPKPEPKVEAKPEPKVEAKVEAKPEPKAQEKAPEKKEPEKRTEPASFAAPSFGGQADEAEPEGFFSRIPGWMKAAAALAVVGIAVGVWGVPAMRGSGRSVTLPTPAAPATLGPESWDTDSTGDTTGIARRRIISRYKPARGKRDYVFEFTGQIEQRAMGWVFRMKDPKNYYVLKLEKTSDSPSAPAQLVKFAVVDGDEQPHRLVQLREPLPPGLPVKVKLDVRGQNFSTEINGRPVDVWIDSQLRDGTVGFSNENGERAVIRTVKVSY